MSFLDSLFGKIRVLRPRQQRLVERLVDGLGVPVEVAVNPDSDFVTDDLAAEFGDLLIHHHISGTGPFTKDKFEHGLVTVLNDNGYTAELASTNNPGADLIVTISVAPERWSLKTQADRSIRANQLHISKFMEMGKGNWATTADVEALRSRFLSHMNDYDRIFSLRNLERPGLKNSTRFVYELVEIPKALLERAGNFPVEIQQESRQTPKPAYVRVTEQGNTLFELYFDGGTERKLQVKRLAKSACIVHATWTFDPPEAVEPTQRDTDV